MKVSVRLIEARNGYYIEGGDIEREGTIIKYVTSRVARTPRAAADQIVAMLTELRLLHEKETAKKS